MNKVRKPSVAGSFYSSDKNILNNDIKNCFIHNFGPGQIPSVSESENRRIKGVIVPHAGLIYSGPIAAHSYLSIAQDGFADCFIIIGPNHRGIGSSVGIYPPGKWESPNGEILMDDKLINDISNLQAAATRSHQPNRNQFSGGAVSAVIDFQSG